MAWLKILKYVAKFAVASGLADKAGGWIKDRIGDALNRAEVKADKVRDETVKEIDTVYKVIG